MSRIRIQQIAPLALALLILVYGPHRSRASPIELGHTRRQVTAGTSGTAAAGGAATGGGGGASEWAKANAGTLAIIACESWSVYYPVETLHHYALV